MTTGLNLKEFNSAQEFWDAIKPENMHNLFSSQSTNLVFRGQRDYNWTLQPKAYRDSKAQTIKEQIEYEIRLLEDFLAECDSTGTQTPEHSVAFRKDIKAARNNVETMPYHWPSESFYTTIAYAQHYGLPTRFLDWSRNSFAAAYFAASGALNKIIEKSNEPNWSTDKKMSVWVLDTTLLHHFQLAEEDCNHHINLVNVSSGINKNIASQKGCFTVLRHHLSHNILLPGNEPFDPNFTLENFLEGWNQFNNHEIQPLLKLTLPYKEVPTLLSLANNYHISESILYPGAESAARAAVQKINLQEVHRLFAQEEQIN